MRLVVGDVARMLDEWAPRWTAWERDNVGLQVGDPARPVRTVGVALDVTDEIVREAVRRRAEMIVCHHPLFFRPPRSVTSDDRVGNLALVLAEKRIALYAAHTNLDSAHGGVNFALAGSLGLIDVTFLAPLVGALAKVVVFVPEGYERQMVDAAASAGGGIIGKYSSCTFRTPGTGTFKASTDARPFLGSTGGLEEVKESRLEVVVPRALVAATVEALRKSHPYEEMAYDVYSVDTPNATFGVGAVGRLRKPESFRAFAARVKRATGASVLRTSGRHRAIQTVAVCGGSGSEYIDRARSVGADVFVTSDVRYHAFQEASEDFAIIDAGHWETEHLVLPAIASRLRAESRKSRSTLSVYVTAINTNPVHIL